MPIIKSIYWDQPDDDVLVYLFPFKDVTTGSVLTVHDSQEAYFFKNGSLCDKFTSGRHVLSSANIPILNKIINLPSGGESTFKANVWFVSKIEKRNLLWGAGGLRIIDPYFQIPLKISARGQYGVRIKDGGMFLLKFVGTQKIIFMDTIYDQFRIDVIEAFKVTLAKFMKDHGVNINELGCEYQSLARAVALELEKAFSEYGVELLNLNIQDISFDENDNGYRTVMEGIAERVKLQKLGVDYLQQKQIDIAQTVAGNQGAGVFMGAGMGIGIGQQMGMAVGNAMNQSQVVPPPPAPSAHAYYVAKDGQTTGPFNYTVIRQMVMCGDLTPSTYVYRVGGSEWVKADADSEIAAIFSSIAPPPPPTNAD